MKTVTISTLNKLKAAGEKFSCLTAYDATFSHQISSTGIEVILIGDSMGMVLQGHNSTLPVSVDDIAYHTQCVARGNQGALIMADMPFMSNASIEQLLLNAGKLMQAGAHMVKIEGEAWLAEGITELTRRGIPVCAHLGLTPQMVNQFGGYKVQGKTEAAAQAIISASQQLVDAGASVILLECVPTEVGRLVTEAVNVPVIGIGAGPYTDGQVLVLHDMLGITVGHTAKFVKNFMADARSIPEALSQYHQAVKAGTFPAEEHCFS
ncbi:3-methyl-2-oxobutanoate hydroxymethyltransferase [Oceanospirillum multiglobuliferum]|uniref:3-methyl-2-oxobutanoate hydroxymethyltransferase n=1 Tax=Oceanospirillum multiglobuliferum TaxID=64969 RepID=A0A1T4RF41_9GAMM|nr:3-methyl-2-oxobutanoate hydroxymethyltransferase [Oceanospirillum multiglobuliferum]OPX54901.1 3-methyl-2-oxobutanoate hydroxymethyltransferase [Oceanospirillum multiglobuliferum]SKA14622.1 3-methyl-2-oxobutanoate hydroxymethyltransferase [Oceanospirillum multiglobuliferum]